jgi:hypothetical protein
MTPEEILRKVGLSVNDLRQYALKRLLTVDAAMHGTSIAGITEYLTDVAKIPLDLAEDMMPRIVGELYALVPESVRTRSVLSRMAGNLPKKAQDAAAEFTDSFEELAKAFSRKPLGEVDEFLKITTTDPRILELADNLNMSFDTLLNTLYGNAKEFPSISDKRLENIWKTFNPYNTNPSVKNSFADYVDDIGKKITEFVDTRPRGASLGAAIADDPVFTITGDIPSQFKDTPTNVVDDIQKIGTLDYQGQWHNTPTVNLIKTIEENNLEIYVKNKNGELVRLGLDETAQIGENAIQGSPMFDDGKIAIAGVIEKVEDGYALDLYGKNPDELAKLQEALPSSLDPLRKPEGTPYKLIPIDTPTNVLDEIGKFVDPELARKAQKTLEQAGEVGAALADAAKEFVSKAKDVTSKTAGRAMRVLDPGDLIIETSIMQMGKKLGLSTISAGALYAYILYEGSLLLSDVVKGLGEANEKAGLSANKVEDYTGYSFTGGKTIDNRTVDYKQPDMSNYGKDFWEGFTTDSASDKYSLSYKISKPIFNSLFGDVYGKIQTNTPTTVGGGGRVRII